MQKCDFVLVSRRSSIQPKTVEFIASGLFFAVLPHPEMGVGGVVVADPPPPPHPGPHPIVLALILSDNRVFVVLTGDSAAAAWFCECEQRGFESE